MCWDAYRRYRTTNFANSAGFLIRCMRLFDAIREKLVPYGTQTFPSVASASLHLINGICAGICSILLFVFCLSCLISALCFCRNLLVYTYCTLLPSTPKMATRHRRAIAAPPLTSTKYGASWDKRRTPAKDFRDYSLVLFP